MKNLRSQENTSNYSKEDKVEESKIKELVGKMTLEEKASLLSGDDFWHTKGIKRLGIPRMMVSDGPVGLRKQDQSGDHLGINESIKAVCFPSGCLTAASFDTNVLNDLGETLAGECQAEDLGVILGPAMNIKRSPLCGRNFEYYSEDPTLSSKLGTAYIKGVQKHGVGTSPKHFAANNQEHRRMCVSSNMSERTLREIYLGSFEEMVRESKPWTIMASYNRINGTFSCENKELLTDILRQEWGFDGFVVSDWGAVNKRPEGVAAGLDLEMPSTGGVGDKAIVAAVKSGTLAESDVDKAAENVVRIVMRYVENHKADAVFDRVHDHDVSKKIAEQGMVLLKNDSRTLPLSKDQNVVAIGAYAKHVRYQGGGSSHINTDHVVSFVEAAKDKANVTFVKGFEEGQEESDASLLAEAVRAAKDADVAVLFVGLPDKYESEGYDRTHMHIPPCQSELIEKVSAVAKKTVLVLHNGSPIEMPWIDKVDAVLEAYLAGEAAGEAEYEILYGDVNPSGRLAETFPLKLEDNPTYLTFDHDDDNAQYNEGVFVGYRYYDKKKMDVLFPFGYGLSYTTFAYSDLTLDKSSMKDTDTVRVSMKVTNTGNVKGREVVQIYVGQKDPEIVRPVRELRAFTKVELMPGETKTVTFDLAKKAFSYWNETLHDFHVVTGDYVIEAGKSSRDIVLSADLHIDSTVEVPHVWTANSTFGDLMAYPDKLTKVQDIFNSLMGGLGGSEDSGDAASEAITSDMQMAMMKYMPLRAVTQFGGADASKVDEILAILNK